MLQNMKNWAWWKVVLLCVLMAIVVGVPISTISAKTTTQRDWLKKTLTYCTTLDKSDYTTSTWNAFQKELKSATAVYKKTIKTDKEYTTARDALEKVKANLMFVSSKDKGNPLSFRQLTVDQIVEEMGAGWNLGNTLDGHSGFNPNETLWQSVTTTKAFIKSVHDAGFNTIRVPVTWGYKIDDENYSIDETWISRVQDIVDYCIAQDMYVIINLHHDGAEQAGWIHVAADDIDPVYEKFEYVWRNIAERFKDYDEHLIFESMNEVTGGENSTTQRDIRVIMNLNQVFVNVVRSTGSNNGNRWLSVPGRYTNIDTTTNTLLGFDLPTDTVKNRLFVSLHHYDYAFGLLEKMSTTKWTASGNDGLANLLGKVVDRFTSKGIPVILGEYGAVNKNNTAERVYHYEAFTKICQQGGIVAVAWDSGDYDFSKKPDYSFSLFNRRTGETIYPTITDAIMRGTYLTESGSYKDIVKNATVTKMTDIILSDAALTMVIGDNKKITTEIKPDNCNDVVLWKTSDSTVATVSNGHVRARGIGTTTLTAFSQRGSVEKTITVVVNKKASKTPCTSIVTVSETYDLVKGKYINLNVSLKPSNTDDFVTYKSSDEKVATVSTLGKVVGCSEGVAYITITASNGITKTVKINVTLSESNELSVALNVLYNDNNLSYFSNETGKAIKITEDGQYTVTFDVNTDLSGKGKKAGVTSLANLTAIYIKDHNVTTGKSTKSPITSCLIRYDKIVVDGKSLTITQKEPKSAIKSSGILDTNDPLNAWDGSSVKEVKVSNHTLNIDGINNPKKIEVTFTISNLKLLGEDNNSKQEVKSVASTSIEAETTDTILLNKVGDTVDISGVVKPADATTVVSFVSSDASVVAVDTNAVAIDSKTGKATRTITALSAGTATITAYTTDGITTTFQVKVGN